MYDDDLLEELDIEDDLVREGNPYRSRREIHGNAVWVARLHWVVGITGAVYFLMRWLLS